MLWVETKVIVVQFTKETAKNVSNIALTRTLKKTKLITFKKIIKKADNVKLINEITSGIDKNNSAKDIEIMFLNERYFLSIPYVNKGLFKTSEDFFTDGQKTW